MDLIKLACEMPKKHSRALSQWDCEELAAHLVREGKVVSISAETVRRILLGHRLRPWRKKMWESPDVARDEAFLACVRDLAKIYDRPAEPAEMILSVDEKTSIQPRPRPAPTLPAQPGRPVLVESRYARGGALNLFTALNIKTGEVYARAFRRKTSDEFIALLNHLDRHLPNSMHRVRIILDNAKIHKSRKVTAWLTNHPRFEFHYTPVHCSWMNQVEQWFSILQRKLLNKSDFSDLNDLEGNLMTFVAQWNEKAHPFRWTHHSFDKVIARVEERLLAA
jgi:transposase